MTLQTIDRYYQNYHVRKQAKCKNITREKTQTTAFLDNWQNYFAGKLDFRHSGLGILGVGKCTKKVKKGIFYGDNRTPLIILPDYLLLKNQVYAFLLPN